MTGKVDVKAGVQRQDAREAEYHTGIKVDEITSYPIPRLQDRFPDLEVYQNHFCRTRYHSAARSRTVGYNKIISNDEYIMQDILRSVDGPTKARAFVRAGPREQIVFCPGSVRAAIVTCGGLCPGLNDVIAELFTTLHYNYGVPTIYGIKCGYRGFYEQQYQPWEELTQARVDGIHNRGGTVLGSSRGGFDLCKIVDAIEQHKLDQLYIIGGDGTHRAADKIHEEAQRRGLRLIVACVPKTIDNDVGVIDRWVKG